MTSKILATAVTVAVLAAASGASAQTQLAPDASASQGRRVYLRCASFHEITARGVTKIGPNLKDVVVRNAGSLPGYGYSAAVMTKVASLVWTEANLDRWLTRPSDVVPGASMALAVLPKPEDRRAMISYLQTAPN